MGDRGTSFPVAGLAVVALFLSTVLLTPAGFDFLRQSEKDDGKPVQLAQPSVEARLWEDPLEALRRHREKLAKLCAEPKAATADAFAPGAMAGSSPGLHCQDGQPISPEKFKEQFGRNRLTIIAAMLPGDTFVGSAEVRRRARYALLAGLNAAGYIPDHSERMSLLSAQRCADFGGCSTAKAPQEERHDDKPTSMLMAAAVGAAAQAGSNEVGSRPPSAPMDIVYETLSEAPSGAADVATKRRRVAILWIDDSLVRQQWLGTLTGLLTQLSPPGDDVRLRIVGPATSEGLVAALKEMAALNARIRDPRQSLEAKTFRENWQTLARLSLVSPGSTAPDEQLLKAAHLSDPQPAGEQACPPSLQPPAAGVQSVEKVFDRLLADTREALNDRIGRDWKGEALANPQPLFFLRTIGPDDLLVDRLVDELFGRGLDMRAAGASRRVALIGEWDSIYARTFADTLQARLACKGKERNVEIKLLSFQYLRGLDGVTVEGAPAPSQRGGDSLRVNDKARATSNARSDDRNAPPVEWPEGRDQRDYLRRLVDQRLGQNDWRHPDSEVQAIGIIGSDVHDKLMIVQALRSTFQDRTVFTTDLDARLLHPAVNRYTRNLIVASSLPLVLGDRLQCGVAPFRDAYQTATFLAARYAAAAVRKDGPDAGAGQDCGKLDANEVEGSIRAALARPFLFEVSRDGAVELLAADGKPRTAGAHREYEMRLMYAVLAGGLVAMLGVVMVMGVPGPAMKAARRWWSWTGPSEPADSSGAGAVAAMGAAGLQTASAAGEDAPPNAERANVIVAMLQAGALGFAAGVVIEMAAPGRVGPYGVVLLALAAAAFFWAFLYPGTRWVQDFRARRGQRGRRWERLMFQLVAFFAAVFVLWMVSVAPQIAGADLHEPFAAINGASAWPSQLLRTLAIVLFAWFLDHAWCRTAAEADIIGNKYFPDAAEPSDDAPAVGSLSVWRQRAIAACRDATIWLWQPEAARPGPDDGVDGTGLWREYRKGLRGWPRLSRIALWLSIAIGLIFLVGGLIGGARPEIPARGIADRNLFIVTLVISGSVVLYLMVLVADVTVLTWRFIGLLKGGRTLYPDITVQSFAAELGKELKPQAEKRIFARATDRVSGAVGRNTLLDDWIDARLLGEHTAVIGPLIIFPFILVALMIVARSRLFDNWQMGTSILIMFAGFVLWSLAMAALLNYGAEMARRKALERMQADLLWLKGAGPEYAKLAEQFPGLIEQVRNMRQGAFAPFFEQPLVKALLVPLGGAGGIQLLDLVLFGF